MKKVSLRKLGIKRFRKNRKNKDNTQILSIQKFEPNQPAVFENNFFSNVNLLKKKNRNHKKVKRRALKNRKNNDGLFFGPSRVALKTNKFSDEVIKNLYNELDTNYLLNLRFMNIIDTVF